MEIVVSIYISVYFHNKRLTYVYYIHLGNDFKPKCISNHLPRKILNPILMIFNLILRKVIRYT